MRFSDRSITDTVVTAVFDVGCCLCFTGLMYSRYVELVGHSREPGMFNSLVFSYFKVSHLLNHGTIWPLSSPHFAVPELPWPVTYASLSHTTAGTSFSLH